MTFAGPHPSSEVGLVQVPGSWGAFHIPTSALDLVPTITTRCRLQGMACESAMTQSVYNEYIVVRAWVPTACEVVERLWDVFAMGRQRQCPSIVQNEALS